MEKSNDLFLRKRIMEVMERGYLVSLATHDSCGVWVSDLIFVHDEKYNLYWMSDPHVRHSEAVIKNPKVAALITVSNIAHEKDFGIQMSGIVMKGNFPGIKLATEYLLKQKKVPMGNLIQALKKGYEWYVFSPDFIELIDKANFGFNKQKLVISK